MASSISKGMLWAFSLLYTSYTMVYLCRKNLAILIPALTDSGILTQASSGILSSSFEFFGGIAKLVCGPFVDSVKSPGRLLAGSLFIAALSNIGVYAALTYVADDSSRVTLAAACWSLNGIVQAFTWPALACVFMNWCVLCWGPHRAFLLRPVSLSRRICPATLLPLLCYQTLCLPPLYFPFASVVLPSRLLCTSVCPALLSSALRPLRPSPLFTLWSSDLPRHCPSSALFSLTALPHYPYHRLPLASFPPPTPVLCHSAPLPPCGCHRFTDGTTRGTWYSILSTTQGLGGLIAPMVLPGLIATHGWGISLYGPGLLVGAFSLFLLATLRDAPASAKVADKKEEGGGKKKEKEEDVPMGLLSSLKVLATNKQYLCLLIGYFPVTVIRSGFSTWTPVMLKETHGLDLASSSMCLSAMEVMS